MSDYNWPAAWKPKRFQMRVISNTRNFTSPYTQSVQSIDMLADFWRIQMDMTADNSAIVGGQIEAFFDRLKGQVNRIVMWNLKRPAPLGTMRGTPVLSAAAAQFANTVAITTTANATLLAGDMLGVAGQKVRVMADATANGAGAMTVEFAPRLRAAALVGAAVTWDKPTSNYILVGDAPLDWEPGMFTAPSLELRESF